mmetsp:Transcript_2186/g.3163  ORF Transcript_2186/g.3163 Transcript_2186/m.3163 type:complete len:90 (-) Transcript_2186:2219-2488(-)
MVYVIQIRLVRVIKAILVTAVKMNAQEDKPIRALAALTVVRAMTKETVPAFTDTLEIVVSLNVQMVLRSHAIIMEDVCQLDNVSVTKDG